MSAAEIREWLQALLAPVIALVAVYIAWRQHATARDRLRLDLYDRRFAVYRALMDLLSAALTSGNLKDAELYRFSSDTAERSFLFGPEISEYCEEIWKEGVRLQALNSRLHEEDLPAGEERNQVARSRTELFQWFKNQLEAAPKKFEPYLQFPG